MGPADHSPSVNKMRRLLVNHFTFFADDLLALFLADGFADLDVVVPANAAAENGFEVDWVAPVKG